MPKFIEYKAWQCLYCYKLFPTKQEAILCESECRLGKHYETKQEWEKNQPDCSNKKPTKKWSDWSDYGLARGW